MSRGGGTRLAMSPTMIGAVTVLVVILAVFLAYNANAGLPFISTYRISALVPNANTLVPGNEVRIGGVRVGLVEAIEPITDEDGNLSAKLDLKLDQNAAPVPEGSTVIVRSRSALGLKYLQLTRSDSPTDLPEGSTLPLSAARPEPVEIDEFLSMFDTPTRAAIRESLAGFGGALTGRGGDLNTTIGNLRPLTERLDPVMRVLASPRTRLGRFFLASGDVAAQVAPVAETQARMFVVLNETFAALAGVARPFIQETISRTPPTLDTANRTLPRIRPFLRNTTVLFDLLRPGAQALAETAPDIEAALVAGTPAVRNSPKLNAQLAPTAASLLAFNDDPDVRTGLSQLIETSDELGPTLRFITPAQSVCNYATLLLRNTQSQFQLGDDLGTWQRFLLFQTPQGPNNEGTPSSAPANGGGDAGNFLHVNPYPNTASPGQTRECEAGNEPYLQGQQVIGNVPGNQGTTTEKVR